LEMEAVLERYWTSGETQRVFTEKEGIGVSTLQYWLRQVRSQGGQGSRRRKWSGRSGGVSAPAPLSLLEVELAGAGRKTSQAAYEIELPDGTHLRFGSGFGENEVRRLLGLLREVR
jgi:transposase